MLILYYKSDSMSEALMGKDIRLFDNDLKFSNNQDFSIISGYDNLKQAIINRLQTIKGEYHNIYYGSELNKCYSNTITQSLKNQMFGYIVEALNQEPRIKTINDILIEFKEDGNERIAMIDIKITPIDTNISLNWIYPLFV